MVQPVIVLPVLQQNALRHCHESYITEQSTTVEILLLAQAQSVWDRQCVVCLHLSCEDVPNRYTCVVQVEVVPLAGQGRLARRGDREGGETLDQRAGLAALEERVSHILSVAPTSHINLTITIPMQIKPVKMDSSTWSIPMVHCICL